MADEQKFVALEEAKIFETTFAGKWKDMNEKTIEDLITASEAGERYDDMVEFVKRLVAIKMKQSDEEKSQNKEPLESKQRNLLSVAYKNVVGQFRNSWRQFNEQLKDTSEQLKSLEEKQAAGDNSKDGEIKKLKGELRLLQMYIAKVAGDLQNACHEVLKTLYKLTNATFKQLEAVTKKNKKEDAELLVNLKESYVFYLKMVGDYYRYLTEVFSDKKELKTLCDGFYTKALTFSEDNLPPTNSTRLGLALNASVCKYEIMKLPKKACELAKKAFDEAIEKLDTLGDESYKDSTLIMQLLRDNLTIWNNPDNPSY